MRGAVLVVEDDEATRESLRDLLESVGIQAEAFGSAGAVLSAATRLRCACLLLDIGLPDQSGIALARRMTELGVDAPVIFMTGQPDLARTARALTPPAFAVLDKPIDGKELLTAIDSALGHVANGTR